jgi:hypothetical protein
VPHDVLAEGRLPGSPEVLPSKLSLALRSNSVIRTNRSNTGGTTN